MVKPLNRPCRRPQVLETTSVYDHTWERSSYIVVRSTIRHRQMEQTYEKGQTYGNTDKHDDYANETNQ